MSETKPASSRADNRVRRESLQKLGRQSRRDRLSFYGRYFAAYTAVWAALAGLIYLMIRLSGHNVFWNSDGVYQHYTAFTYVVDTLRAFAGKATLSDILPLNYTIGQGADILTTLGTYDYTDPISWLCASLGFLSTARRFVLMIFIKLWLAGAAMSVFCFALGKRDRLAVLCGALSYTFSGAILYMFPRHPNHFNWAYFLPLMLAGVEYYRRRGHKPLLILAVCFNLIVSYYTFFVDAVVMVTYILVVSLCRIASKRTAHPFRDELLFDLRLAGLCVLGVLLSCIVLAPSAYAFTLNPRVGELTGYRDSMLYYSGSYYFDLFATLFTPFKSAAHTSYIGMIPPVLIGIGVLFSKHRRGNELKTMLLLMALFMCIPMVGRLFNGMGYVTNRWAFAIPLFGGVVLADTLPLMRTASVKVRRFIVTIGALYVIACCALTTVVSCTVKYATMGMILLCLLMYVIACRMKPRAFRPVMTAVIAACVLFNIGFTFAPLPGTYVSDFFETTVEEATEDSATALSGRSTSKDFFRVESLELISNVDGIHRINSTGAFWSVLPSNYYRYMVDLEQNTANQNCNFKGLDGRAALLELASVRYYTTKKNENFAPYGYRFDSGLSTHQYNVYENPYALPIGYSLPGYITREDFEALSPIGREQALMQAVVTDEPLNGVKHIDIKTEIDSLPFTVSATNNATLTDTKINAATNGATVTLTANIPEHCEIFLRLGGIEVTAPSSAKIAVTRKSAGGAYSVTKTATYTNMDNNWPVIRDGVIYDLGSGGEGENTITLTFSRKSRFTMDAIELYAVPMAAYETRAQALTEYALQNAYVDGSTVRGDITLPETRPVQFSVAYSTGFSATVDGNPAETVCTDDLYLSVVVPAGTHHIELHYATPYLKHGAIVSLVTAAGLIVWALIHRIRKKRNRVANCPALP
ncbi:MAG: YfhO family protein [Clostridia bacterium]|nr:YfhO family protein [Clostridia bacterium]